MKSFQHFVTESITTKAVSERDQDGQMRYILLIKDGDHIFGSIELIDKGDHLKVDQSYIDQHYRYKGYGPMLYRAAMTLAREHDKAWLKSGYAVSPDARAVWSKIGGEHFQDAPGTTPRYRVSTK